MLIYILYYIHETQKNKKTKLKRPEINKNTIIPYVKRGYSFYKIAKIFNTYRIFISRRFYLS